MSEFMSVFVVVASKDEGEKMSRMLIEEDFAACVNLMPDIRSFYRWQGKIVDKTECALIIKTHSSKYASLEKRICEIHSYECPCIVAMPVADGNPAYLEWLRNSKD